MPKFLKNPAVISSITAIILVMVGLMFPNTIRATHIPPDYLVHSPTPVTPVAAASSVVPTATQPSGPPSSDEARERAMGITRPGIDTSGGGFNTAKAQVTLCSDPAKGCAAGNFDILVPFEPPTGRFVKLVSFNTSDSLPKTSTFTDATNPANGWSVVESASSKGSNWRNIQIFNAAGTLVANFDIKVS